VTFNVKQEILEKSTNFSASVPNGEKEPNIRFNVTMNETE